VVVDLSQVKELKGIREVNGGREIAAMMTLTEVVRHLAIKEKFSILSEASESAASPQIRNQGTIGGNVSQNGHCCYYRGGWPCYRAGGKICYADTPSGMNREHAMLGADRWVAVKPTDSAPALIVFEAKMVVRKLRGCTPLV
jgi:xanthine dehydrogenase YagS FAD-binding subunit